MLSCLSIENFQSHEHSFLEFSKGINVITGSSDSGKTAILRALYWIIWNRPQGDSFKSWWGGDTKCSLVIDKKFGITRSKDKDNLYLQLS